MAHDPQALTIRRITTSQAARAFVACAGLDPAGAETPESAAQAGECFAAVGPSGAVAFAVEFAEGVAWVVAAAGGGSGMAGDTLAAIESLARGRGCSLVGFQTVRPGLRRIAQRRGYVAAACGRGVKLEKKLC